MHSGGVTGTTRWPRARSELGPPHSEWVLPGRDTSHAHFLAETLDPEPSAGQRTAPQLRNTVFLNFTENESGASHWLRQVLHFSACCLHKSPCDFCCAQKHPCLNLYLLPLNSASKPSRVCYHANQKVENACVLVTTNHAADTDNCWDPP